METKKTVVIATIAILALAAVGAGYAYNAITTTTNNSVDVDYFEVVPLDVEGDPVYTFGQNEANVPVLKYDTKKNGSATITWRLDSDDLPETASSQSITKITKLRLLNNDTGAAKTWGHLDITISGGTLTPEVAPTTSDYFSNIVNVKLKIGNYVLNSVNMTRANDGLSLSASIPIEATTDISADQLVIPANSSTEPGVNNGYLDCNIEITIADDSFGDDSANWHTNNLSGKTFNITFKATAADSA